MNVNGHNERLTMDSEIATTEPNNAPAPIELSEATRGFMAAARSESTNRAYRKALESFAAWLAPVDLASATAGNVADWLTWLATEGGRDGAGVKSATVALYIAGVRRAFDIAGAHEHNPARSEVVAETLRGIRRKLAKRDGAQRRVDPLTIKQLRTVTRAIGTDSAIDRRDRALLLVGFAAALRRSELCNLQVQDLAFSEEGVRVTLATSKTNQAGAHEVYGVPHARNRRDCPVHALRTWLESEGITSGPVFRGVTKGGVVGATALTGRSVARIIQRRCDNVDIDPATVAGHSLRAGFATSAHKAGHDLASIARQTGHSDLNTLKRYLRHADPFTAAPALL